LNAKIHPGHAALIALAVALLGILVTVSVVAPSVVDDNISSSATMMPNQPKEFYAAGRHWVFYADYVAEYNMNAVFTSSTDGTTWETPTVLDRVQNGWDISVLFDGTYVYYAINSYLDVEPFPILPLVYRMGVPEENGEITWLADEQTVCAATDNYPSDPTIAVDSSGHVWVAYDFSVDSTNYVYASYNDNTDGIWENGIVTQVNDSDVGGMYQAFPTVLGLAENRMYFLYLLNGIMCGRLWNGSSFEAEENLGAYGVDGYSATSVGDNVYVSWHGNDNLNSLKRTYGVGWGEVENIAPALSNTTCPVLTAVNDNLIYCFYGNWAVGKVYYRTRTDDEWGDENILDDSVSLNGSYQNLNSFLEMYSNKIGLAYMTDVPELAYEFLEFNQVPNMPDATEVDSQTSTPAVAATAHSLTPTFSFRYTDNEADPMTAFEILVGTDNDLPPTSIDDMWAYVEARSADNGDIISIAYGDNNENGIEIVPESPLENGVTYYWVVRTTDRLDNIFSSGWSDYSGGNPDTAFYASVFDVYLNHAPTCTITAPPDGYSTTTGVSIAFASTASDPDNDSLTFYWQFGDTGTSASESPTHSYLNSGTYSVSLTVSDGELTGSNSITIHITGGGGPFGGGSTYYTITTGVTGSGSVSPQTSTFASGTSVTVTATPDVGWYFDHWTGDLSGSANPATITMSSDKAVTAYFSQTPPVGAQDWWQQPVGTPAGDVPLWGIVAASVTGVAGALVGVAYWKGLL
jgi:hypothetical protein